MTAPELRALALAAQEVHESIESAPKINLEKLWQDVLEAYGPTPEEPRKKMDG